MANENQTVNTDFYLVGFSDVPELQGLLFCVFVSVYLMIAAGNLIIMTVVYSDRRLHTPMYFFLSNLSFVDIGYTSVIFPKMLVGFSLEDTHISFKACMLQLYFFVALIVVEIVLLSIMAYDRYVAICNPLHYAIIMNKEVCLKLATGAWIIGFLEPIVHTILISNFSFCQTHQINHFFCDITALMKLSCTSTRNVEIMSFTLGVIVPIFSIILIITSYVKIISAILKIKTTAGRQKAFSTCASHLTVVVLYYGSLMFVYLRPASTYSVGQSKVLSFLYIALSPMCNPIVYTLKNQEFKNALKRRKGGNGKISGHKDCE
ncbi:olfactory receptor 8I2-like [Pleurodeles waltl]|uniref:olfactory receptor 8I2-like n=1 Tax=Pleurodeles waltl TaxID=8319 RepID=UPI0037093BFA